MTHFMVLILNEKNMKVGLKLKFKKFSLQNMNLQWKICDFIQTLT